MTSVHLIGGGWDDGASRAVYGDFARRVAERGGRLVYVLQNGTPGRRFLDLFASFGLTTVRRVTISALHPLDIGQLHGADGVFVCGGVNPLYQRALADAAFELRALVQDEGVPYAGFSAGAVVAAEQALVGGWRTTHDEMDVEVCAERRNEGLRDVTVAPGVGLVPFAVDVHGTQWGTISRAVHALEAGLVDDCVLVDENTSLDIDDGLAVVRGLGSVYRVHVDGPRVVIETYLPGASFRVESSAAQPRHTAAGPVR
jgi:cyanophycinase